jgi:dihydrofolate reductase
MSFSIIAAVGKNNELGKDGDLCFHLKSDMRYFKETTSGHVVIMGGNTFRSLKKPLPNRVNVVLSRGEDFPEGVEVCHSIDEIIEKYGKSDAFVIGGGKIYEMFLPYTDKLYLTEVDASSEADTYFPTFDKSAFSREVVKSESEDGINFTFAVYSRKESL